MQIEINFLQKNTIIESAKLLKKFLTAKLK